MAKRNPTPAPKPEPVVEDVPIEAPVSPGGSTFAERRAARLKAVRSGENKAVQRAETK